MVMRVVTTKLTIHIFVHLFFYVRAFHEDFEKL